MDLPTHFCSFTLSLLFGEENYFNLIIIRYNLKIDIKQEYR